MASKRTNSYTKKRFLELLTATAGSVLGVSNNEEIVDIKVLNNTVVIAVDSKLKSRRGHGA
jgi:hypothetical protein